MSARYRLEQFFERLRQPGEQMRREDVCFVMVQARHLVEASRAPERFRIASFYADWTVHTALDRSPVCFEVLRDITAAIARNMAPTSADLTSQVSRIIGFPQLRSELTTLFRENDLPGALFEHYENWSAFVAFLLWNVAGQPISFPAEPKGRARAIRDEMLAQPRPHNIAVEGLAVVNHEGKPHWFLQLSGDKSVSIAGAIDLGEPRDAFTPVTEPA